MPIDAPEPPPSDLARIATALEQLVDLLADATVTERLRASLTHQPRSDDLTRRR